MDILTINNFNIQFQYGLNDSCHGSHIIVMLPFYKCYIHVNYVDFKVSLEIDNIKLPATAHLPGLMGF